MNVAAYQAKSYPYPPCWALVTDVYANELGSAVLEFGTVTGGVREFAALFLLELHKGTHGFHQISEPQDLCVVLMGATKRLGLHHCGVYHEGNILHAQPEGVLYQPIASVKLVYPFMEFWAL